MSRRVTSRVVCTQVMALLFASIGRTLFLRKLEIVSTEIRTQNILERLNRMLWQWRHRRGFMEGSDMSCDFGWDKVGRWLDLLHELEYFSCRQTSCICGHNFRDHLAANADAHGGR